MFLERLYVLEWTGNPNDGAVVFAKEILTDHDWPADGGDGGYGASERQNNDKSPTKDPQERGDDDDDRDSIIRYIANVGGDDWIFHRGDADFFPSIPHGHKKRQNLVKLDPYLGWMYERSNQCGRIKREDIIALWNDDKFRDMASVAIDYYLFNHPHYTGWRVASPRRIPRRGR
ncbi:MAG: hypothetical protein Q8O82_04855 [Pseudorhodobacter sp.]|nr:hypothetical protein [Pseudorhodobacter sp.]